MRPLIDRQIQGILIDRLGKRAIVRRKGRTQAWRGVLGYHENATTFAVRDGNTVLIVFALGDVMSPIMVTPDGMEITLVP
jgi:hypothetical protein